MFYGYSCGTVHFGSGVGIRYNIMSLCGVLCITLSDVKGLRRHHSDLSLRMHSRCRPALAPQSNLLHQSRLLKYAHLNDRVDVSLLEKQI